MPSALPDLPRFLTQATPSGSFRMDLGGSATIQLPRDWSQPIVDGTSVELVDIAGLEGGDVRQWEVRSPSEGLSTVTATNDEERLIWSITVGG